MLGILQQSLLLYVPPVLHIGPPQGMHKYIEGEGKQVCLYWCSEEHHELRK